VAGESMTWLPPTHTHLRVAIGDELRSHLVVDVADDTASVAVHGSVLSPAALAFAHIRLCAGAWRSFEAKVCAHDVEVV
jgi:hypothetical protein